MRRSTKLLPLLLALPVSACLVAAASLTAVVASQEFIDHATVAYLEIDHETVWMQTKDTLGRLSLDPIEVEEAAQAARCNIDGARVTVHVEISGVDEAKLAVGAKKWGFESSEVANDVINRIKSDLER